MENKLPENAKLVFKGVIYDVYQWDQEMFDGNTETFERLKRRDTATVIAAVGDKIILLEQEQPAKGKFLSLPGGRAEEGEETIETAKREMLEETGYVSQSMVFWKRSESISTILWNSDCFIARGCSVKQNQNLDSGEKITVRLIDFEDFLMLSEDDSFRHNDLKRTLLYLRLHPESKEEFKRMLFGAEQK